MTLFASADSSTSATLAPCCPTGLRRAGVHHAGPGAQARRLAESFDVIHFHIDNGRLDLPDMHDRHGMPDALIPYSADRGKYLAFLGRISPEKRPDRAIDIALRAGIPLKLAAKATQSIKSISTPRSNRG